jgi:Ca2+/Na+ antiporter
MCFYGCFSYPHLNQNLYKDGPYMAFLIIIMVSMINEDTLESQAGITFYVFFSLFLYLLSTTKETVKNSISNR